ncbi:MAG: aryl-sulfate sulfotransferase, partial [Bacteroidota bacterium]
MNRCILVISLLLIWGSCRKELPPIEERFSRSAFQVQEMDYVPLSRQVSVNTNLESKVSITVLGHNGAASNVQQDFNAFANEHELAIHGLYADTTNRVVVQFFNQANHLLGQDTLLIETVLTTENLPSISIEVPAVSNTGPGDFYLISYRGKTQPMVPILIDQFGDIRWLADFSDHPELNELHFDVGLERLQNGNWYFGDKVTNQIYEMTMEGAFLNAWSLPGYAFHHNVQETANGNFLVTVSKEGNIHQNGTPTVEDVLIELDRNSGTIIHEWNLLESLDENRVVLINNLANPIIDWIHVNAVQTGPTGQGALISGRTQGVVLLDEHNQ